MIQPLDDIFIDISPPQANNCRICLQRCPSPQLTYCGCKGSHRYVHEGCLLEWARSRPNQETKIGTRYINCDLCKEPIQLQITKRCQLRPCDKIWAWEGLSSLYAAILLGLILLVGVVFGMCLVLIYQHEIVNPILGVLMVVTGVLLGMLATALIAQIVSERIEIIEGIKTREVIQINLIRVENCDRTEVQL